MKQLFVLSLCATLLGAPGAAQNRDDLREGVDLLSEATRLLLRGLAGEIEPALRELEEAFDDWNGYHPPEILPNGDIIIRRKQPKSPEAELSEDSEIEL